MNTILLILSIISVILVLICLIILILILNKNNSNQFDNKHIDELIKEINTLNTSVTKDVQNLKEQNKEQIETISNNVESIKNSFNAFDSKMIIQLNSSYKELNASLNVNLDKIRSDNENKLNKIQEEVTNKLDQTLNNKLQSHFNNVITQLGDVNKSVGEIKSIASDVGSLKSILTNVKTKGITGEVILGTIIDEVLTKNQYSTNVVTKVNSKNPVEYAINLPNGKDGDVLYLPIDSKFPTTSYNEIIDARNEGNKEKVENAQKELKRNIKNFAKDIRDKYIDEPNTTPFAIMFLPNEGLFCEVINDGLFEEIQNEYKVIITGPTTFTAILNALRVGFKTLQLQKKSGELYNLLIEIKKEFFKFAECLEKTQTNMNKAQDSLNELAGTRTRQLKRQLDKISDGDDESEEVNETIKQ